MKEILEESNLPKGTIYDLRHTTVSLMIAEGVSLTTISKMVGHSSTQTTARIYAHSIQSAEQEASAIIANMLEAQ